MVVETAHRGEEHHGTIIERNQIKFHVTTDDALGWCARFLDGGRISDD